MSALYGGEWSASCFDRFIPVRRAPKSVVYRKLVILRASIDVLVKGKMLSLTGVDP
jgi:hypothetical protein